MDFLRAKMKHFLQLSYRERRNSLNDLMDSNRSFRFDGRLVCTTFLFKAFRFSGDLISSIRNGSERLSDKHRSTSLQSTDSYGTAIGTSHDRCRGSEQRDSIISFLERLAESTGDIVPEADE